jgi:diguanylate cyclase (GGDEF)-like protein
VDTERAPKQPGRRVVALGATALLVLALVAGAALIPIRAAQVRLSRLGGDLALDRQVVGLQVTLSRFEQLAEPNFQVLATDGTARIDPSTFSTEVSLGETQVTQAKQVTAALRDRGLVADAQRLDTAAARYNSALSALLPAVTGAGVPAGRLAPLVEAERAAFGAEFDATTDLHTLVSNFTDADSSHARSEMRTIRVFSELILSFAAFFLIVFTVVKTRRTRRKELARRDEARHQIFESELQQAFEMTKNEPGVYSVVREALRGVVPMYVELLVADSNRAHFHQALNTAVDAEPRGCGVISPIDCPAASRGQTMTFPSSRALDACPQLKGRPSGDCSAVCMPLSIGGRSVAVFHATGPDGESADASVVRHLAVTARRMSDRVAMLRAFEKSEVEASTDPLTGLLNRRSLHHRSHELESDGTPYSLAYGDLDHFKDLNDTHGHDAGDRALKLFARVVRDAVRPRDVPARYGGEEFVIVLPECDAPEAVAVLERLRERLALALTSGHVVPFTVSFGLASSDDAATFDDVLALADHALLAAKAAGRNRVVQARPVADPQPAPVGPTAR